MMESLMSEAVRSTRERRSFVVAAADRRADVLAMLAAEGFGAFEAYERVTDTVLRGLVRADEMRHVIFAVERAASGAFVAVVDEDWFLSPGGYWRNVFGAIESQYRANLAQRSAA